MKKITFIVGLLLLPQTSLGEECYGNDVIDGKQAYSDLYQWYQFARVAKDDAKSRFLNTSVAMEFIDLARSNRYYSNNIGQMSNYLGQIHHWMDGREYQPVIASKLDELFQLLFTDFVDTINHVNGMLSTLKDLRDSGASSEEKFWYERELGTYTSHQALPNWKITCHVPEATVRFVHETVEEDTSQEEGEDGYPLLSVFEEIPGDEILHDEVFHVEVEYDIKPEHNPETVEFSVQDGESQILNLLPTEKPNVFRTGPLVLIEPVQP